VSRSLPSALAWATCIALVLTTPAIASAQSEPVKPYIVFITDVSGSMTSNTGFGPASCVGSGNTRIDHAKCAINNIANSYGEMVMALARFRQTTTDTNCANGCTMDGIDCDPDGDGLGCTQDNNQTTGCAPAMQNGDRFEVLVPILENNQSDIIKWTDFQCAGTCASNAANPELFAAGYTPLAGSLVGAKRYWQGLSSPTQGPYWTGAGSTPIASDPLKNVFTSPGNQCRPYITILLTDGEETCATSFNDTTAAASALLTTAVGGQSYKVITKPIGFGITPGNAEIEGLAHAGGEPDVAGVNEGGYAQSEEELQLEISRIIADAIKFELCNAVDDDCDTLIDEGYDVGAACDDGELGVCHGTGVKVCTASGAGTECVITDPGGGTTPESCNGLDDDCDGTTDEGVCAGCLDVELCNNIDDDCDTRIDEDLTRPCGTDLGICTAGTETCTAGQWGGCTATGGHAESCDGTDEDCDGTVDGFAEECSDLPGGNPSTGPCHPGVHVCPTDGSGHYGPCLGEVGPAPTESCDLVDNDCDGDIDEDTGGADCSSTCGVGVTRCVDGVIVCDSQADPQGETCNGLDDDCDGIIDEEVPPGAPTCDDDGAICDGHEECLNGHYVCVGESAEPELCNCLDDDCNNQVDDGEICPGTSECVHPEHPGYPCQCADECSGTEFPCPVGRICVEGYCLVDPCAGVTCTPDGNGDRTQCVAGECVRSCDLVTCGGGFVCYGPTGTCEPDDCRTFPDRCAPTELCVGGTCVSDACAGVDCATDEYCVDGACHGSCAGVDCPAGERCRLGECEADPCGHDCPGTQACNPETHECQNSLCSGTPCPEGERCDPLSGDCKQDPCLGVECPGASEVCVDGSCYAADDFVDAGPDAQEEQLVTTGGGGGCDAGGGGGGGLALLAIALGLVARRRARGEVRS